MTAPGDPGPAGPDGRHGPHALVDDVERPVLAEPDRHHLRRVVRLRDGDPLTVGDGAGRWRPARFGDELAVDGPVIAVPAPSPRLVVALALVKGERPELAVQKLTELGVDEIVLFAAQRSVVRWQGDRLEHHRARLVGVARAAAQQSRRVWLPAVHVVADLAAVVERHPDLVRADRDGVPPPAAVTAVAVGPEGGWTDEERALLPATVALGTQVLRAETAAIAAGTLLGAMRAGLVRPAG